MNNRPTPPPKIKICGLRRLEDIHAVNKFLPDYIGFVFAESKRQVTPAEASAMRAHLHEKITPVGVFVNAPHELILSLASTIDIIQLHGNEDENYIVKLKTLTGKPIIKVSTLTGDIAIKVDALQDELTIKANVLSESADYYLFDSPGGGTGKPFDWNLLTNLPNDTKKPFFLAGGLNTANISEAIKSTNPYAVDTSSGVETNGFKDPEKIKNFIETVRAQAR